MKPQVPAAQRMMRTAALAVLTLLAGFLIGTGAVRLARDIGRDRPALEASAIDLASEAQTQLAPADALPHPDDLTYTTWDPEQSPNYYRLVGRAIVRYDLEPGQVRYAPLDAQGRARGAAACITYDTMTAGSARPRENLANVSPTGWGRNQEVDIAMPDGTIYHGQLFNRSHLLAKSLGGDDEMHNLICATRTQNVGANVHGLNGGMAYGESLARDWLERHRDGTVYYAAIPVYEGDEAMAHSVMVDIRTSDGSIDQRIEVYNAALGFSLDYATGTFAVTEAAADAATRLRGTAAEDGERKVVVTGSGRAYHHDEQCRGLSQARSMRWVSVAEAEQMGRRPCGICGG